MNLIHIVEKATALLLAACIIILAVAATPDWATVGATPDCGILPRLSYSFFHASVLHAIANSWCLLSIAFMHHISLPRLAAAYIIAAAAPDIVLAATPTVGLSAVCFALLGSIAFQVRHRLFYNAYIALYIAFGFLFPLVNGWLHLYSYAAGLFVGFLTKPIPCRK